MPPATSGLRPRMRFCVLGPVEVFGEGGDPLPIAGSKERTISPISSLTRVAPSPPTTSSTNCGANVRRELPRRRWVPTSRSSVVRSNEAMRLAGWAM